MTDHETDHEQSFSAVKKRLRKSFINGLPQRFAQCRADIAALQSLSAADAPSNNAPGAERTERLKRLHLSFHSLKGSGASLELDTLADLAEHAETLTRDARDAPAAGTEALAAELSQALQALERHLDDLNSAPPATEVPANAPVTAIMGPSPRDHRIIYLCDDDPDQLGQLVNQLACFGYSVQAFSRLDALRHAMLRKPPAALVIDVMFPEGENAGPDMLSGLRQHLDTEVPSIFISSRDDFSARLHSVQAGSSAFCAKPVNIADLIEFLDQLTNPTPPEQFNILIVDDEPEMVRLHAAPLEAAGMVCQVVTDPTEVLDVLQHFRADLVLMDLHMPRCSGQELACVLRQIPGYVSLPIIFLSAETDQERQFHALQSGADGFLVKPIAPRRLVEEVRLRAERMRTLRSLMVRDSLTGLFNHNTILNFLDIAVANAQRKDGGLCFAMIDVDHFKQVNDSHGHPAGDQVLMALSRTLRLRLRDSDPIGRYGGEEFAIVLTDSSLEDALSLIETLREDFSRIEFQASGASFHCTFSAGIAAFPSCPDTRRLTETADQALYQAKHAGRNRVVSLPCVGTVS